MPGLLWPVEGIGFSLVIDVYEKSFDATTPIDQDSQGVNYLFDFSCLVCGTLIASPIKPYSFSDFSIHPARVKVSDLGVIRSHKTS